MNWIDLEREFTAIAPNLRDARLDGQWGAAGDYWRVAAAFDRVAASRFEILAGAAGRRLVTDEIELHQVPGAESDPTFRWYKFLQYHTNFMRMGHPAQQINDDGSSGGWLFTGSIADPARVSAALCLQLSTREVIESAPEQVQEDTSLGVRTNTWLEAEARKRGRIWYVLGGIAALVLAALALL